MEWSPRERPEDDCDEGDGEEVDVDTEENHHSQNHHQQQQGMSDFLMLMSGRHQQQQNLLAQQQWAMFNDQNKNERISEIQQLPSKSTSPTSSSNNPKDKEEDENEEKKVNEGINERREKKIVRKRKFWSIADTLGNEDDKKEEDKEEEGEINGCAKQPEFSRNAVSLSSFHHLRPETTEKVGIFWKLGLSVLKILRISETEPKNRTEKMLGSLVQSRTQPHSTLFFFNNLLGTISFRI